MIDSKVVPFAQGADFLHARGMKLKRSGNWLDALDLLRRAQEAAPEGEDYRMDMAAVYADMDCHADSRAMTLMHIFSRESAPEAYFQLAKYDAELGALPEAEKAYEQFLLQVVEGEAVDEAREELSDIRMAYGMWRKVDRETRRKVRRLRQVRRLQAERDFAAADAIFERELQGLPEDVQMRVNRAMNLSLLGDVQAARREIDMTLPHLAGYPSGIIILAAQVYHRIGDDGQADQLLSLLQRDRTTPQDWQMLMALYTEMGRAAQAYHAGQEALKQQPYDRRLLHQMAVAALRTGIEPKAAAQYWQRILRISPLDDSAQFYLSQINSDDGKTDFHVDVAGLPPQERIGRSKILLEMLDMPREQVVEAWQEIHVRRALHWALFSENPALVQPAIRLLAAVDEPEGIAYLAEFIARTHLDMDIRLAAAQAIRESRWKHWPGVDAFLQMQILPGTQEMMDQLPVPYRQMVRMTQEYLQDRLEFRSELAPALYCGMYLDQCSGEFNRLLDLRCGAAALAVIEMRVHDEEIDLRTVAKEFGCSVRKLKYYLEYLGNLPGAGG